MNIEKYVLLNQQLVDKWKDRFECLLHWNIRFVYDGENWSHTKFDIRNRMAVIFPCDIDDEESWIIHEILKLAFISTETNSALKFELVSNLVAILQREYL